MNGRHAVETDTERRDEEDRRAGEGFRFLERRGGFDRRARYPILGTLRYSTGALLFILVLLNVLSVLDGLLTAGELHLGVATEGNPVLGQIIGANPLLAVAFKVIIMILVSIAIWRGRRYRAILAVAPLALAAYVMLLAYHLGSLRGLGIF